MHAVYCDKLLVSPQTLRLNITMNMLPYIWFHSVNKALQMFTGTYSTVSIYHDFDFVWK